jgi:hypothetical protein
MRWIQRLRDFFRSVWHDMKHGHTAATLPPAWMVRRGPGGEQ